MDRRQQKTRRAIFEALSSLLEEKNYSRISVQDIVERANIGRSTFYTHFETKDDLLRELCVDLFNHVFSYIPGSENTHDFSAITNNQYSAVTHILYHISDSDRNIVGILTCESKELFLHYFKKQLSEQYISGVIEGVNDKNLSIPQRFLSNHIAGSFVNMIEWWISEGLKQTPEELTEYFKAIIDPIVNNE